MHNLPCLISCGFNMVLSGPPASLGGSQNSSSSLMRSNSGFLRVENGPVSSQNAYRGGRGNNMNILSNVSSLFGGEGSIDSGALLDRYSNGIGFDGENPSTSSQHIEQQHFQQQFSLPPNTQVNQQFEPQLMNDQLQQFQQQQKMFQIQQWQQQQQTINGAQPRVNMPQHLQQQNLPVRATNKSGYEPGMCARRLMMYMFRQQQKPKDNNIEFWRNFVNEYYAPNARKKWCVSMYGNGRNPSGVLHQDSWHCDICNLKPGRGFEASFEVLARLFKIKYESGTLEELLYIDMPHEYPNSSGQIVLDYAKAIQEGVFEQLRVVREGQLRIIFTPDLKICSWEFCARRHDELIPRRLLMTQVNQLGIAAQKYQTTAQNPSPTTADVQNNCNMFIATAKQLSKAIELPLVNDLGYSKRYVRCLQISEVVNSMKDLIDHTRRTGVGPIESLAKFPRINSGQSRQPEEQPQPPTTVPMSKNMTSSVHGNGPTSSSTISVLIHQNSMNSRQHQNSIANPRTPYSTNFRSPPAESSNQEQSSSQSSSSSAVQRILQEMMSRQVNGSSGGQTQTVIPNGSGWVGSGLNQTVIQNGGGGNAAMNGGGGRGRGRGMSVRQQELNNQMLMGGGFNGNLQHDWRSS